MADESGDIEMGFMDDDIEIDDDIMDDMDLSGGGAGAGASGDGAASTSARKVKREPIAKPEKKEVVHNSAPQAGDFLLRAGGKPNRNLLLARFNIEAPNLKDASKVRLYRQYEGTERGRERGLKRDAAEVRKAESYVGKKKQQRLMEIGTTHIMERDKKSWVLEVTPSDVTPSTPPREEGKYPDGAVAYKSKYEGVTSSANYAIMVMHRDGKHVDVVPIGDYSWHTFRRVTMDPKLMVAKETKKGETERAEQKMKSISKRSDSRMTRMEQKYEMATESRERLQGGFNRFEERRGYVSLGIKRKVNEKIEKDKMEVSHGMDWEQEFDNDDVAQVDAEELPKKSEVKVQKTKKQIKKEKKMLNSLLKDETVSSGQEQEKSDSEEDDVMLGDDTDASPPLGRPASPDVKKQPSVVPATGVSGSRAGTPSEGEPGLLMPTKENVVMVVRRETVGKGRTKVRLQEVIKFFHRNDKKKLISIFRAVVSMSDVIENGKRSYYVGMA